MDRRKIFQLAANLIKKCKSNDPLEIAQELGITIIPKNFEDLLGMYLHIERNRFTEEMRYLGYNLNESALRADGHFLKDLKCN